MKNIIKNSWAWCKKKRAAKKLQFDFIQKYRRPGLEEYMWYLSSPLRIVWTNFLAGIARGFGFVLGATVIVTIALYITSKVLVQIPLVGHFFEWLNVFLQENLKSTNFPTSIDR